MTTQRDAHNETRPDKANTVDEVALGDMRDPTMLLRPARPESRAFLDEKMPEATGALVDDFKLGINTLDDWNRGRRPGAETDVAVVASGRIAVVPMRVSDAGPEVVDWLRTNKDLLPARQPPAGDRNASRDFGSGSLRGRLHRLGNDSLHRRRAAPQIHLGSLVGGVLRAELALLTTPRSSRQVHAPAMTDSC